VTRILLIPVAGTLAALAMVLYAHRPRGETDPELPPFDLPDAPEHAEPLDDVEPTPRTFRLELRADGTFFDLDHEEALASVAEVEEVLGDARHTLVLSGGEDVPEDAVDEAVRKLRDSKLASGDPRFEVRKAPPPAPQTFQLELEADGTILDVEKGRSFASVAEAVGKLGAARHTLAVTNGRDVTEAALDEAVRELRESRLPNGDPRFQVRKVFRARETPPGEGR
jgi:hypothetical protein